MQSEYVTHKCYLCSIFGKSVNNILLKPDDFHLRKLIYIQRYLLTNF